MSVWDLQKGCAVLICPGLNSASDLVKTDCLAQACEPGVYKITTTVIKETGSNLEETPKTLGEIFPTLENDLTIRRNIESLPTLGYAPIPKKRIVSPGPEEEPRELK